MMQNQPYHLAKRFAGFSANSMTCGLLDLLDDSIHKRLFDVDAGGDLYIAGISLIASIGPLEHQTALRILLDHFDDWWTLDGRIAKIIATTIDESIGYENQTNDVVASLPVIKKWLDEDVSAVDQIPCVTSWQRLLRASIDWDIQDQALLRSKPSDWESILPAEVFNYHTVVPITSSTALADYAHAICKFLARQKLVERATAGDLRFFAAYEVLHAKKAACAAFSIELIDGKWRAGSIYLPVGRVVPQRLYKLARAVATRYQSKEQRNIRMQTKQRFSGVFSLRHLVGAVLSDAGRANRVGE